MGCGRYDLFYCSCNHFVGNWKSSKEKIFSLNNILNAHNPINILAKGYAIIEDEAGKVLKSKDSFGENKEIKISMEDGYVKGNFTPTEKGGFYNGKKRNL